MLPSPSTLFPRQPTPELILPLVSGGEVNLAETPTDNFHMLVFYRGQHCPACKAQLVSLKARLADFSERGVTVTAISCDSKERAQKSVAEWALDGLKVAYSLKVEQARQWGLFISASRGKTSLGIDEPALFSEPGLFLIRPDGTLFSSSIQTMPFARPHVEDIISALDFIHKNDYPARGDVV